jgi:hypothetical protein
MEEILKYLKTREKRNLVTIQQHLPTINLIKDIYEKK